MTQNKINEIFILYSKGKYKEAKKLNDEILKEDPNNMYALRYAKLLDSKILNENGEEKKKKVRVKGKVLKCPHCLAKISFSSLTEEQRKLIKTGNYNNLEIKCPYCHTSFVLQKKKAKSILGLKIGEQITYKGKKYRITGYTEYYGHWYEGKYSGGLKYLEWLLLGEDNSYLYFSEGKSSDDGEWIEEFEFSTKFYPSSIDWVDYINGIAKINGKIYYTKEIDKIKVISIYGENSKNTKVGEKVELYDFGDFIIEKESSGSQSEAGFYKKNKISKREAAKIFNKNISELELFSTTPVMGLTGMKKYLSIFYFATIIGLILFFILPPYLSKTNDIEIGKTYYLGGEYKRYNGTTTCSDDGDTRTCYSYTKYKGLSFSIKDNKDIELYNKLKNSYSTIPDEKLKKIISGSLYSFHGDYTRVNWLKGLWLFFIFFILIGSSILFGKSDD